MGLGSENSMQYFSMVLLNVLFYCRIIVADIIMFLTFFHGLLLVHSICFLILGGQILRHCVG